MKVVRTELPGVLLIEPRLIRDERGFFMESYNRRAFSQAVGETVEFVQDNLTQSARNVLRGLHYQLVRPQGKLVSVLGGEVFDVAVDLRRSSPDFGRWTGFRLSEAERRSAWIPAGFAHGYLVLSESAQVLYKVTDYWAPEHERSIAWNDPQLGIRWPLEGSPVQSPRDAASPPLARAEVYS